jgi:starch phosphorylase
MIDSGFFSPARPGLCGPLIDSLLHQGDPFMVLADYAAYVECQERVSQVYGDPAQWTRMSILNCARMGKFSSDRTIRDYAREIWNTKPVPVELGFAREAAG